MKIVLLLTLPLIAACASPRPYQTRDTTSTTAKPSSYSSDTSDCERQAALAGAGDRAKAFADCMRSRNRTPGK